MQHKKRNRWAVKTAATQTKPACAGFHTPSFSLYLVKQAQGKFGVAISLATSGYKAIHTW
jgi:neutral trehalase